MNIPTIEMPIDQAKHEYARYRTAVRERYGSLAAAREADAALVRAYRALAKGQRVIDVVAALGATGLNSDELPVLAICRADAKWCACNVRKSGSAIFKEEGDGWDDWTHRKTKGDVSVPVGTFPELDSWGGKRGRSMVPEVPIHLHPEHGLGGYHILWEATWEPIPPGDPLLLKRLSADLFAVLAQWDLSPIEQAVLRGLRTTP
jgi:hypothetical protein